MTAMQTLGSASLVVLLLGSSVPAFAEPDDAESVQRPGEVQDDDTDPASAAPGRTPSVPAAPEPLPPPKRAPTGTFTIGAGFSTDDSFIATASIAQNSLFGSGHRLALDARISARDQAFRVGYDIPHLDGGSLALHTELYANQHRLPGFRRDAAGGGVALTQQVGDHVRAFFGYRVEEVHTDLDDPIAARGTIAPPPSDVRIASLRTGIAYSTLDQPFLPTRGTAFGVAATVADPRWGSEVNLTRLDTWGSVHRGVGPFILHLGGSLSTIASHDPGGVPLSERLFLDGSSMIRGYAPGSIGPHSGGNLMYAARGELEVPLIPKLGISAVGFLDHGGIFDTAGAGSTGTSAGFGLIWRSPIGPLRFDWAFPLDGGKPRFVFGLGTMF